MTKHVEGYFPGAGIGQIYWQGWLPAADADAVGVVVIVHGAAEHSGRYAHVGSRLATEGYASYAFDIRGHGRSEGVRANINRMSEVVADLDQTIRQAAVRHEGASVYLLGHSMGGLAALDYVTSPDTSFDLRGLILSGPAVQTELGSKAQRVLGRALSAVLPNFGVLKIDATAVSRDPAVVSAYDTDPLNYRGKLRLRTGAETLVAADRVQARLSTVELPILVMHGTKDRLTSPAGSQLVADRAGSSDITLKLYDGLYHEVFNEPEQDSVLDDVVQWLRAHG
ncbi:MAG: lysophospholipase [Haloechinothrix sp.]